MAASSRHGSEFKRVRPDVAWFQRLAHHDFLTGLPNRRQTEQVLRTAIAQAGRSGFPAPR